MWKISLNRLVSTTGVVLTYLLMLLYFSRNSKFSTPVIVGIVIVFVISVTLFLHRMRCNNILITGFLLTFLMSFTALANYSGEEHESIINMLVHISLWFIVLWLANIYNSFVDKKSSYLKLSLVYFIFATITFTSYLYSDYSNPNKFYEITTSYYILNILPTILLTKNKMLRKICVTIIVIVCVISFKRSVLVTLLAIGIMLLLQLRNKGWKKTLIVLFAILIIGMVLLTADNPYVNQAMKIWIVRFTAEDGNVLGERGNVYSDVISLLWNSNLLQWIVGHGYNSVMRYTKSGLSAHNDYLEILFDYGMLTFGMYIRFIYLLIKEYIVMHKAECTMAFPFLVSICTFCVPSLFSHLMTYPTYFLILALFWGWTIRESKNYREELQ